MKKTFKLIDKYGFLSHSEYNLELYVNFISDGLVKVDIVEGSGRVGGRCVIGYGEWIYFEEVTNEEETSYIPEQEIKDKRKIELTEKIFLAVLSNPEFTSSKNGEEMLEIAGQYAEMFIEEVEGGDK